MDAHVGQGAQRRLILIEEPCTLVHRPALGAGVAQHGAEGDHVADNAAVQQLLGTAVYRVEALIVADHQVLAAAAVLGGHLLGTGAVLVVVGHDLRIGVGCILGQMAHLRDLTAADDTNSNHTKAPPLPCSTDGTRFSFKL